eukprot:TRINITY_DN7518_c0_g1_i1.p1 TRINITY_DN7518_c0_g1~~TRINITY_DN7518_c0_g1_i1.p1  ORF type:complete len:466 (-),score=105.57 TRINITY_DN7518_c0_g1_i1:33-1430(-)
MAAVIPKLDCPHLDEVTVELSELSSVSSPCKDCQDTSENWLCLKCNRVSCSRYISSHAAAHFEKREHAISVSFSDLSVWCYKCDSYIKHTSLQPILQKLLTEKQDVITLVKDDKEEDHMWSDDEEDEEFDPNAKESDDEEEAEGEIPADLLRQLLHFQMNSNKTEEDQTCCLEGDLTLEGITRIIREGKCKNIVVMTGAGISVAAGIPDFRTPGTGLYDNLQKYDLPHPTAVFELEYFKQKPEPFYLLAKELYPGNFEPTATHFFIRLLHEKGLLLRNFTQNIDTLERVAGIPGEVLVEAHGSFASAHCIACKEEEDIGVVKEKVFSSEIPRCKQCGSLVKPDIVFFGESLPTRFFQLMMDDFAKCDLLIVIGTSLQVQPFASLIHKVNPSVPRLLINNEVVGRVDPQLALFGITKGFRLGMKNNYRDVAFIGDCQDGVKELAKHLGWKDELNAVIEKHHKSVKS